MTNKILELTEKIYNEGIEKANLEAKLIIASAKREANTIISAAEAKEKQIVEMAHTQAAEIKKNTDSEIRMAAKQFTSNLKQQISKLITTAQVEVPVKDAFKDNEFIKDMILEIIKNWNPQKPEELNISLLLPQKAKNDIDGFFNSKAKEYLDSGLEINFQPNIKSGFMIGPKDGSYHISFSDKSFENYFKNYLKEKTKKMIFN